MNSPPRLPAGIAATVKQALMEDVGAGDLTAALVPSTLATAVVITREAATLCGCAWFDEVFRQLDAAIGIEWQAKDGDELTAGQTLCVLRGPARSLLTGERTALNFLQTLSATATVTARYVEAVAGTGCRILDTRKTLPGLRLAQKYAVRCGGGVNHRIGLFDAMLVKENHIAAAGSITAAVAEARRVSAAARLEGRVASEVMLEVEVETLQELREALACPLDRVLLDNFSLEQLREAATLTQSSNSGAGRRIELEASGNITLENLRDVAATGVDYISVGGLTKHVRAIDLSMRMTSKSLSD